MGGTIQLAVEYWGALHQVQCRLSEMQATIIHNEFLKSHLAPTILVRQEAFLNSLLGLLQFAAFKPKYISTFFCVQKEDKEQMLLK